MELNVQTDKETDVNARAEKRAVEKKITTTGVEEDPAKKNAGKSKAAGNQNEKPPTKDSKKTEINSNEIVIELKDTGDAAEDISDLSSSAKDSRSKHDIEMDHLCRKWFWRGMIDGHCRAMMTRCIEEGGRKWSEGQVKKWQSAEKKRIRESRDEKEVNRLFVAIGWVMLYAFLVL